MERHWIALLLITVAGCSPSVRESTSCECGTELAAQEARIEAAISRLSARLDRLEHPEVSMSAADKDRVANRPPREKEPAEDPAVNLQLFERQVSELSDSLRTFSDDSQRKTAAIRAMQDRLDDLTKKCASGSDSGSSFGPAIERLNGDIKVLKDQFRDLPGSQHNLNNLAELPGKLADLTRRVSDLERK